MSFHDIRFPVSISLGASGGPERRTEIVTLGSGFEERNSRWADSRRTYDAGYGVKDVNDLHEIIGFFEERRGRLHAFRWKDWSDFKSCAPQQPVTPLDQTLGTGDGAKAAFQLVKVYGGSIAPYTREIKKPVAGTARVGVAGVEKAAGTFGVDQATGIVTFVAGHIPEVGQAITAGFEFDVPARFDTDTLAVNLDGFRHGSIPNIPLVEVRI